MSIIDFLLILLVAALVGFVAQRMLGRHGGLLASLGFGFLGALLGTLLARFTALPALFLLEVGDTQFPLVWSLLGALLLVAVTTPFVGRRRYWV